MLKFYVNIQLISSNFVNSFTTYNAPGPLSVAPIMMLSSLHSGCTVLKFKTLILTPSVAGVRLISSPRVFHASDRPTLYHNIFLLNLEMH